MTSQNVAVSPEVVKPEYPTCHNCGATGPQQFGWFRYSDGRDECGECRYPVPAGACPQCRGAGRYTIGAQTDALTGNAIVYHCPTCSGSGKAASTQEPDPLPDDWQVFRGLTVRDKNGTPMVWRENAERSGYYPAGSVAA